MSPLIHRLQGGSGSPLPEDAAQDIQTILEDQYGDYESAKMGEETAYAEDSYYERKAVNSGNWQDEWRSFENSMRKENRFFSPIAADYLGSLFGGRADFFHGPANVVIGVGGAMHLDKADGKDVWVRHHSLRNPGYCESLKEYQRYAFDSFAHTV